VSVVVDRGRGSTTTNYEGLMMRVSCDIKRVNMMVRTCLEVVVHCLGKATTSELGIERYVGASSIY
jgi:hypothetical protein